MKWLPKIYNYKYVIVISWFNKKWAISKFWEK